jgi:hypothetical protein
MTVYVVQELPQFNIVDALRFGDISVVLPPGNMSFNTQATVKKAYQNLRNFTSEDYLLMIGDPVAMSICFTTAVALAGGTINILKWDRQTKAYFPVKVDLLQIIGEQN